MVPHEKLSDGAGAASYVAASGSVVFGLSANEVAAYVGAVVALLTFMVNVWFKYQHLKLAKAKAEAEGVALDEAEEG